MIGEMVLVVAADGTHDGVLCAGCATTVVLGGQGACPRCGPLTERPSFGQQVVAAFTRGWDRGVAKAEAKQRGDQLVELPADVADRLEAHARLHHGGDMGAAVAALLDAS